VAVGKAKFYVILASSTLVYIPIRGGFESQICEAKFISISSKIENPATLEAQQTFGNRFQDLFSG
jgi:hypothetical protein